MLRQVIFLIALIYCPTVFAQTNQPNSKTDTTKTVAPFKQKDTTYWIDNFRQFRDALYKSDKTKAKEFINFPFNNEGNEIWYLAYSNDEKATDQLTEKVNPFTERDFDKYFTKIFPKQLVSCLLKIKTDDLYKKGKSESPEIKDSLTTYKLYVTFDNTSKIVELNLATRTPYKTSDTTYETGESNFIYRFQVAKNGHIKLKKVLIAG